MEIPKNWENALNEAFNDMMYARTDSKMRFPNGLRYLYYNIKKRRKGYQIWWFCYSTVKNENGKFISWIYKWKGNEATPSDIVEHRKRKDADARSLRLCKKREEIIKKN